MNEQFRICYRPGGMGLDHSAWWVCATVLFSGVYVDIPVKRLRRSDYKLTDEFNNLLNKPDLI